MKILAFDTSSARLSAAVYDGVKKLAGCELAVTKHHSETLVPALQKLLKQTKIKPANIECIAVGVGPGSFTGLRVAVTTAKTLAYALNAKIIGISSLEAAARSLDSDGEFAPVIDAKKNQVYAAVYRRKNGQWKTVQKPQLVLREDFLKSLAPGITILDSVSPRASAIAEAALERIKKHQEDDLFSLEPLYLHPKDCNVSKSAKK